MKSMERKNTPLGSPLNPLKGSACSFEKSLSSNSLQTIMKINSSNNKLLKKSPLGDLGALTTQHYSINALQP